MKFIVPLAFLLLFGCAPVPKYVQPTGENLSQLVFKGLGRTLEVHTLYTYENHEDCSNIISIEWPFKRNAGPPTKKIMVHKNIPISFTHHVVTPVPENASLQYTCSFTFTINPTADNYLISTKPVGDQCSLEAFLVSNGNIIERKEVDLRERIGDSIMLSKTAPRCK